MQFSSICIIFCFDRTTTAKTATREPCVTHVVSFKIQNCILYTQRLHRTLHDKLKHHARSSSRSSDNSNSGSAWIFHDLNFGNISWITNETTANTIHGVCSGNSHAHFLVDSLRLSAIACAFLALLGRGTLPTRNINIYGQQLIENNWNDGEKSLH